MTYSDDLLKSFYGPTPSAPRTPTPRADGAAEAGPSGVGQGDMNTGASEYKGETNSKGSATVQTHAPTDRPQNDRGVA